MRRGVRNTAIVLIAFCVMQLLLLLGLLAWELYAVADRSNAELITTTMKLLWANQPWVVLIIVMGVTGGVMFLFGHFFAGPTSELDRLRHQGEKDDDDRNFDREVRQYKGRR